MSCNVAAMCVAKSGIAALFNAGDIPISCAADLTMSSIPAMPFHVIAPTTPTVSARPANMGIADCILLFGFFKNSGVGDSANTASARTRQSLSCSPCCEMRSIDQYGLRDTRNFTLSPGS